MIKVGLVGCGRIARGFHIPSLNSIPEAKIVAICDNKKSAIKRVYPQVGKVKFYFELADFLAQDDLDIVDICTPGYTHYPIALESVKRGFHVIVEKPVALSLAETLNLIKESEKNAVKVGVMQTFRYKDNVLEVQKAIQQGKMGRVTKILSVHHGASVYSEPSWLWDEEKSGGILYELGIHHVDLQSLFCGKHKEILGLNIHYQKALNYMTGIEAIVKYKNGAIGILDIVQDTTLHSSLFSSLSIYGTAMDAVLKFYPEHLTFRSGTPYPLDDLASELKRTFKIGSLLLSRRFRDSRIAAHKRIIQGFIMAVKHDSRVPVGLRDVINTMELLEDLRLKAREKKPKAT